MTVSGTGAQNETGHFDGAIGFVQRDASVKFVTEMSLYYIV